MDKITIIVPIFNQENYLDECITSIINQTYTNIEVLLIDDESTDKSFEICCKYRDMDNRIKVFQIKNSGLSGARNFGLDNSTGKYIMFCDSDDFYFNNTCELLYNAIDNNNADYAIGNYINCYEDGTLWNDPIFDKNKFNNFFLNINDYDKSFYVMSSSVCNKIFRKSFIDEYNIRFIQGVPAEDAIFTTYCFIKSKRTYYINDIIYGYRQRLSGTSISTNNNLSYFEGISKAYKYIYLNFKNNNEMGFYRYFYLKTLFYITHKFIDTTVMNNEDKIKALNEMKWFYKLTDELKIKDNNHVIFEIIRLINNDKLEEAISKCNEVASKRMDMNDEDKLKMSKIQPNEYKNYLIEEV